MIRIRPFGVLFRIFVMCLAGSPWGPALFQPVRIPFWPRNGRRGTLVRFVA